MGEGWGLDKGLAWVVWRDDRSVGAAGRVGYTSLKAQLAGPIQQEQPEDLLHAWRNGQLEARRKREGTGGEMVIDPCANAGLELHLVIGHPCSLRPRDEYGPSWTDVIFSADAVQAVFPPATSVSFEGATPIESLGRVPSRQAPIPEAELRSWDESWVRQCQQARRMPSPDDDYEAATQRFERRVTQRRLPALRNTTHPP